MSEKNLINWGELSRCLTGNRTNIRRNKIPKKYQFVINRLLKLIEIWLNWQKRRMK
jgi:hypothetical protein